MSNNCDSGKSIPAFVLGSLKHSEFSLANEQEVSLAGHKYHSLKTRTASSTLNDHFSSKASHFSISLNPTLQGTDYPELLDYISSPICLCLIFVPLKEIRMCQKKSTYSLKLKSG